jgi:hypothetical protein
VCILERGTSYYHQDPRMMASSGAWPRKSYYVHKLKIEPQQCIYSSTLTLSIGSSISNRFATRNFRSWRLYKWGLLQSFIWGSTHRSVGSNFNRHVQRVPTYTCARWVAWTTLNAVSHILGAGCSRRREGGAESNGPNRLGGHE